MRGAAISGRNIKKLREGLGLTQSEFCAALSVDQSVLSKIESGKYHASDALLIRIALKYRSPELLVDHCRNCHVLHTTRELYPVRRTNAQMASEQFVETVLPILDKILDLAEGAAHQGTPQFDLQIMELSQSAAEIQSYAEMFRLIIDRPY